MREVLLRIHKYTLKPNTHPNPKFANHVEWIVCGVVSYDLSRMLFSSLSATGPIRTDAQFAKWICDRYGPGQYLVLAWRKGYKGMWNFMKLLIYEDGTFQRLRKNISMEEKEKLEEVAEYKRIKRKLGVAEDEMQKEMLSQQLEEQAEMVDLTNELLQPEKGKAGCYPYLKSLEPVYKRHGLEEYETRDRSDAAAIRAW